MKAATRSVGFSSIYYSTVEGLYDIFFFFVCEGCHNNCLWVVVKELGEEDVIEDKIELWCRMKFME